MEIRSARQLHRFSRRYWLRLVRLLIVMILVVGIVLPLLAGAIPTYAILHGACGDNGERISDFGHAWESVAIPAHVGGQFRAYFVPSTNGATIIVPPAHRSGLNNRLAEADVLIRHGYGVLGFESRVCAKIGSSSLGYKEVSEVGDALHYLQTRSDVDSQKIGILGFSSAGATSIMAAARYPKIKAVVAEGGYADMGGLVDGNARLRYPDTLIRFSIRVSYRLFAGISIEKLSPVNVIKDIYPRPILLIYGTEEPSLPGAHKERKAAGDNAELWVVEGAIHGGYMAVAAAEYEQRVIEFFNRALLQS
ncbi:MAG: prolyl oligopeptidase family serine peptidase [Chloroflexi bacterium]|nr:prolyl oligopeptidase family serine peptidase [Chloroflexota bacterium]